MKTKMREKKIMNKQTKTSHGNRKMCKLLKCHTKYVHNYIHDFMIVYGLHLKLW